MAAPRRHRAARMTASQPRALRTRAGGESSPADSVRTEKLAFAAIEEARMVLPGIQALFGFQLIAAFSDRFHELEPQVQALHFLALVLIAVAIAIIMALAAYHRLVERGSISAFFVRLASGLLRSQCCRSWLLFASRSMCSGASSFSSTGSAL
jgi:hypothetical protein